jgi:hypothetical protein
MLAVMAPTAAALVLAWQYEGTAGTKVSLAVLDAGLIAYYLVHYIRRISQAPVEMPATIG